LVTSMVLYLPIRASWHLLAAGVVGGIGHALLFPAVVAAGSSAFPVRYRGLGVTLMLGAFDLGGLVGMPLAGWIIVGARSAGWPEYPAMFLSMASLLAVLGVYYAAATRDDEC